MPLNCCGGCCLFHISHSPGKLFRRLFYFPNYHLKLIIRELCNGTAGADGCRRGAAVIKYRRAYAPMADLVFLVIHGPALTPDDLEIALELPDIRDGICRIFLKITQVQGIL